MATPDYMELQDRVATVEEMLDVAMTYLEQIMGSRAFRESETVQHISNRMGWNDGEVEQ